MVQKTIGVAVSAPDSAAALANIQALEQGGIPAAWMTSGSSGGGDSIGVFTAAAALTQNIMMGTAIVQTFPRHPIAVAQQVLTLAQIAPGRFRLGLGTSGRAGVEQTFGVDFRAPLAHLREYIRILKSVLQQGSVDFSGRFYQAHTSISDAVDVPVMAAALGARAYEMCGAEADGAISWVCPSSYLQSVALPSLRKGAERNNRPVPPLIAQVPVCVHDSPSEARQAIAQQFAGFARSPFYQNMFTAAGFPEVSQGTWSDGMIDAVGVWGDESKVAEGLLHILDQGATEILASPVPAGEDLAGSLERTLKLLAQVAKAVQG